MPRYVTSWLWDGQQHVTTRILRTILYAMRTTLCAVAYKFVRSVVRRHLVYTLYKMHGTVGYATPRENLLVKM